MNSRVTKLYLIRISEAGPYLSNLSIASLPHIGHPIVPNADRRNPMRVPISRIHALRRLRAFVVWTAERRRSVRPVNYDPWSQADEQSDVLVDLCYTTEKLPERR